MNGQQGGKTELVCGILDAKKIKVFQGRKHSLCQILYLQRFREIVLELQIPGNDNTDNKMASLLR